MPATKPILYCRCAYAKVVPREVKEGVLASLAESDAPFDAVADLCEMSAKQDPALARLASQPGLRIAACYPRAVKWLFSAAGSPLPEDGVEIVNMRELSAEQTTDCLLNGAPIPAPKKADPPEGGAA